MTDPFTCTEDQCLNYLTEAARYNERLVVEARDDGGWIAELRIPSPLAGEVVPMGEGAAILPDGGVSLGSGDAPDRLTALRRLTYLAQDRDQPS